jgi:hypothetical protein
MNTFFSPRALTSLRAAGYKNTQYALAELIDNAFDAEAKNVKVLFFERKNQYDKKIVEEILVCDNGAGMDQTALSLCLQFGNTGNRDLDEIVAKKKKGLYGFGLPNASLSQCPSVHVFSRQNGSEFFSTYLDLEELKQENSIEIPPVKEVVLPKYYVDCGAVMDKKKGTIVAWRECDRLSNTRAATLIDKSARLLGQLYRYLLNEGKTITLESWELNPNQGTYTRNASLPVVPNDPLFLMENTYIAKVLYQAANTASGITNPLRDPATYYKIFSVSKTKCKPTNLKLVNHSDYNLDFEWKGKIYKLTFTTSIADKRIQKPGIREGGRTDVGKFYGQKDSISFVRAGREISTGDYGLYARTDARNRWWTIEVQFTADADPLLGVHNNKQGIEYVKMSSEETDVGEEWNQGTATLQQAREHLWLKLTIELANIIRDARKEVLKIDKEYVLREGPGGIGEPGVPGLPTGTEATIEAIKKTEGDREGQFTEDEKRDLFARLRENYPNVSDEDIKASIEKFDQWKVRGVVLYHSSKSNSLWELTPVAGILIVLINTEHEFYKRVIEPLRIKNVQSALAAIELFISSLAWEEHYHFTTDERKKDIIEAFRNYAGLHLNVYLKDNKIVVDEDQLNSPSDTEIPVEISTE